MGQGTTFKIYLPAVDIPGQCQLPQSDPSTDEENLCSGILMVVEDNVMVRELTVDVLSRVGYTVFSAGSGGECLHRLHTDIPNLDLLLTDVVMPNMNGKALYKEAAKLIPGLKVLYMSGYTENVIASRGVLDANIQFIAKPFTPKGLVAKVREVLGAA